MFLRWYGCDAFLHNGFVVRRRWTKEIGYGESKVKNGERAFVEFERTSVPGVWYVGVTMITFVLCEQICFAGFGIEFSWTNWAG